MLQVLAYGIASAAILRLVVIGLGIELVDNLQVVNLGFAAFLIFNAWQMVTAGEDKEEDLADKWIVKACRCAPPLHLDFRLVLRVQLSKQRVSVSKALPCIVPMQVQ